MIDSTNPFVIADNAIRALVVEAAAKHPELGMTFGYIGNWDRHGDDRSFRIFTNRKDSGRRSISYHLGSVNNLPAALSRLPYHLDAFIAMALKADRAY
jgi:hypothetical protein